MADEKGSKWQCYIIPDLATWTGAAGNKPYTPIEFYDTYEQAATRFRELRSKPYNGEELPGARLTFGVQREDPPSAADLLHVRQGQNYLVDDYTRMASLNDGAEGCDFQPLETSPQAELAKVSVKRAERNAAQRGYGQTIPQAQRKGPGIKERGRHVSKNTLLRPAGRGYRPPSDRQLGALGGLFSDSRQAVQVPLP